MTYDTRRSLLVAALAALRVKQQEPELALMHRWLDSWAGIGHIVGGMQRQGRDLELVRSGEQGWRAGFYLSGFEHSLVEGTAQSPMKPTPWEAVQAAAWEALTKAKEPEGTDWSQVDESPR